VDELAVKIWLINNLKRVFPGMTLVTNNVIISGMFEADLHLKDGDLNDVFLEIKPEGLVARDAGRLLNHYLLISNLEWARNPRLIVITPEVSDEARSILTSFGVEIGLINQLGIDKDVPEFRPKELKNVLTPVESEVLSYIHNKECGLVAVDEISDRFDLEMNYSSKILERLEKKEYLERIKRGRYLYIPFKYGYDERYPPMNSLAVGSVLVRPYYYGYQTANRIHGYTSQFSPVTYICTTKTRREFRWRNTRYRFVKLIEGKLFGCERRLSDGCEILVAEPEKAILDALDKPEYCGGTSQVVAVVASALRRGVDHGKLLDYVKKFGSNTVIQRLGYVSEFLNEKGLINVDETIEAIEDLVPENPSYTLLGSVRKHGRKGPVNSRWGIVENIDEGALLDELEVR
jgi:predicted transcriptional regulator of viral defense system